MTDTADTTLDPLGELTNEEFDALSPQAKGARTRKANADAEEASTTDTDPLDDDPDDSADTAETTTVSTSYVVLKGITLGTGQTLGPGDTLTIADNDPDWPARRPAQLVKQGYLRLQEG